MFIHLSNISFTSHRISLVHWSQKLLFLCRRCFRALAADAADPFEFPCWLNAAAARAFVSGNTSYHLFTTLCIKGQLSLFLSDQLFIYIMQNQRVNDRRRTGRTGLAMSKQACCMQHIEFMDVALSLFRKSTQDPASGSCKTVHLCLVLCIHDLFYMWSVGHTILFVSRLARILAHPSNLICRHTAGVERVQ